MIQNYNSKSWENMVLTQDDRVTIAICFNEKGWRGARLMKEFPSRWLNPSTVHRSFKKKGWQRTSKDS